MAKNDWYDAGDQIRRLVQDAVDSKDFSQLSSTIANVVNDTVNGLQSALKENLSQKAGQSEPLRSRYGKEYQNTDGEQYSHNEYQDTDEKRYSHNAYQYTNREAAERIRRNIREKRRHAREVQEDWKNRQPAKDRTNVPVKVKLKVPGELSGKVMKWTGYSMSTMLGMSLAILVLISLAANVSMVIPGGILAILFGLFFGIGLRGSGKVRLAGRFRRYQSVLGSRTYCLVEELASAIGKNDKFVQKDLKKMIEQGFFKEGYLARRETLLITDNSTYQQYLGTQTEYERRAMAAEFQEGTGNLSDKAGKTDAKANENGQPKAADTEYQGCGNANLTPECREIIKEGRKYIQHIHECNEKIQGQEISAKLDRLEVVITRIFREAEKNPDAADELKKMMSYYLPTTKKLLDAYCELDEQPIAGQNIGNTKKEIENALDTINTAFENLLDSFFEEKAWDISSDITVLHTMLAQEGLTGTDFASSAKK